MSPVHVTSAATGDVLVEQTGYVVSITLNRPAARNALTRPILARLTQVFDEAGAAPDVRCVTLAGAGGHFCAGADLRRTFAEDPALMDHLDAYLDAFHAVIKAVVRCPKPTIASMDGAAVGFGADLALACDLRVAASPAYLQEKFVHIGLMPDGGGTFWLPRLVGTARAMRAMLLGDKLEAQELHALGLLVELTSSDQLHAATRALAARIAKGPPLAYAQLKRAVYANWGDLDAALQREREGQLALLRSEDMLEGVAAWTQKREPDFKGR